MKKFSIFITITLFAMIMQACSAEGSEPSPQNTPNQVSTKNVSTMSYDKLILIPEKDRASVATDTAPIMEKSEDEGVYVTGFIHYNKSENKIYSISLSKIDVNTAEQVAFKSSAMPPDEFFHRILDCMTDHSSAQGKVLCVLETTSRAMKDCQQSTSPEDCWMF